MPIIYLPPLPVVGALWVELSFACCFCDIALKRTHLRFTTFWCPQGVRDETEDAMEEENHAKLLASGVWDPNAASVLERKPKVEGPKAAAARRTPPTAAAAAAKMEPPDALLISEVCSAQMKKSAGPLVK